MRPKIIDTRDIINGDLGIFSIIYNANAFEWLDSTMAAQFDYDYYLSYSSDKKISWTYQRLLELEAAGKIVSAISAVANIILNRHKDDWDKIYETMTAEYNPLDNYNYTEVETPDITKTRTSEFKTTTDSENNVYGFDTAAADGVPLNKGNVTVSGSSDDNVTTDTEGGTRTREKTGYDVHPADNIYKTLDLLKINLFELLAKDVDSVMTDLYFN